MTLVENVDVDGRPVPHGEPGARLRDAVSRRLSELGLEESRVFVERREELARSAGGKLQLVVGDETSARRARPGAR